MADWNSSNLPWSTGSLPIVAGGGGGGGSNPGGASGEFITCDLTDGTWTLEDPDSLIDTSFGTNGVQYSGGYNLIQWNQLATGSTYYNWASNSDQRSPRWYKDLVIGANQVLSGDTLNFTARLRMDVTYDNFNQHIICACAVWPELLPPSSIAAAGAIIYKTTGSNPNMGAFTISSTGMIAANPAYVVATTLRGSGGSGAVAAQTYNVSDQAQGTTSRPTNLTGGANDKNIRIMVAVGPASNVETVTAGDQQRFKAEYCAFTVTTA